MYDGNEERKNLLYTRVHVIVRTCVVFFRTSLSVSLSVSAFLARSWQARSTFLRSKNQRAMQKMLGSHLSGTQRNTDPPWRSDVSSARGQHRLLPRPLVEKQMLSEQDVSAYCVPSKKQTAPPQMWQHVLPNATFRFFCPGRQVQTDLLPRRCRCV